MIKIENIKKIHLIAICGSGMGSLAGMLKESGYQLSGSDLNYDPPMGPILRNLGITLHKCYDSHNIATDTDMVIIGNAVSSDNVEVKEVKRRGIPYLSLAEALNRFFFSKTKNIVVAGTHGKTTTTSLLSWILHVAGLDPSFMVGGIPGNFHLNYKLGNGELTVLEGDEYNTSFFDRRPKFIHYNPRYVILTNIEYDHADIFPNMEEIYKSFQMLLSIIPKEGYLLHCGDYPELVKLVGNKTYKTQSYGISENCHWQGTILEINEQGMTFNISNHQQNTHTLFSPIAGKQNLQNIIASVAMAKHIDIPWGKIEEALKTFKGVKRRQELLDIVNNIRIILDFAHHPTAIYHTLKSLKKQFPQGKLVAVFEPRTQTSRRNIFQNTFPNSFSPADVIILAPVYNPYNLPSSQVLSTKQLREDLEKEGKIAYNTVKYDEILDVLLDICGEVDVVVFMSSGSFNNVPEKFIKSLK